MRGAVADQAVARARDRVRANPGSAPAWRALARALRDVADGAEQGAMAYARSITASIGERALAAAERAVRRGELAAAETAIAALLARDDDDVVARRLSGDLAMRRTLFAAAEAAYRACLDLAPSYGAARQGLAAAIFRQARLGEAWREAERLLVNAPTDPAARTFKAAVAASIGDHRDSIGLYRGLVREKPDAAPLWLALGHGHRIVGERAAAIAAYREAIARDPRSGAAYWSLANLKNFAFSDDEIAAMTALAEDATLADEERAAVHFALGHAVPESDRQRAFDHFHLGNAAKRRTVRYDADRAEASLQRWTGTFTTSPRAPAHVADAAGPIFVVGLPRSGSTLVEQILGSHAQIEATSELPYLDLIAQRVRDGGPMPDRDWAALGRDYLALAAANRHIRRARFVDKMPNNFAHVGLIRLILPQARIVDVRRHPLAACLSIYRQLFGHGQPWAYDLVEIARWYRVYVAAMDRFELAFPGYVHRLHYEALVDAPEDAVRRLLDHVGVPFDPACLHFHLNGQPVRTPSSEQVRRPIFRDGLDEWRRYRERLAPAAAVLTELIDAYPATPAR